MKDKNIGRKNNKTVIYTSFCNRIIIGAFTEFKIIVRQDGEVGVYGRFYTKHKDDSGYIKLQHYNKGSRYEEVWELFEKAMKENKDRFFLPLNCDFDDLPSLYDFGNVYEFLTDGYFKRMKRKDWGKCIV